MSKFRARFVAELDTSKIEQELKKLANEKLKINLETESAQKNVENVNKTIKKTSIAAHSFGDTLKKSLNFGAAASIVYRGFDLIKNAVNKALESVKDFDKAIMNLRMATGDNYDNVSRLLNGYNQMAQTLGATTTEVAESADTWLRQGKSIEETNKLIKNSMMLSKIGQIDSASATEYLTSSLKGFKLSADDAIKIVDKLSAVDLESATNSAGLAEAMSKTSVSANMAGVNMDKLLGYLAATGEVTQESMSIIGNAYKTFFARYSDIKTGKLELIDEDGTTETLSDVEQSLKNVGIDMRTTITDFNNAGDSLDSLAEKWDSLNSTQQSAIAKAFGGTRQKERFLVLMENYDNAKKYMEVAANSAGTAEEKFSAYLDTIEAKTKTLQATFEALATDTLSADMFGDIVEASSAVLEFVDNTNLLKGSLAGIATVGAIKGFSILSKGIFNTAQQMNEFNSALTLLKAGNIGNTEIQQLAQMTSLLSHSQLKAVLSSNALSAEQRMAILTSQGLSAAEAQAALSSMGLATAQNTAATSTMTLSGTLKGLWATLKAHPIMLIASAVSIGVSAFQSYQESIEKAQQATIDAANQSKEHIQSLESSLKSYYDLDTTATEDDRANAIKSVTEQLENKTEALKNATAAEKGYTDEVKNSIEMDYQDAAGKAKAAAVTAKQKIAGQWRSDYTDEIQVGAEGNKLVYDEVKDILGKYISLDKYNIPGSVTEAYYLGDAYDKVNIDTSNIESLLGYYELLKKAQNEVQQKALELGEEGNALLESPLYKSISEILSNETNKQNIDDYVSNRSEEIYGSAIASNGIPDTIEEFNELKNIMLEQTGDSELLADTITTRLNEAFSSLADKAVQTKNTLSNVKFTVDTETFSKQLKLQKEEIENIAGTYKKISEVIDDYNNTGNITVDNIATLMEVGDEYIGTLFDENGQLNLNKDSYVKLTKAKLENIRYSMLENAISNINKLSKSDETVANDNLATSTGKLTEETLKLAAANKVAEGVDSNQIQGILNTYSQWSAIIDNVESGLENNTAATLDLSVASDKMKDNLEAEKKALEDSKSALEDKKKSLEKTKNKYEDAQSAIQSLIDWTKKYITQTKEDEIKALEEKRNAVDDNIAKQKELLQAERDRAKAEREIADKQNVVASNALSAAVASLDDSSAGKKAKKQADEKLSESRKNLTDYLNDYEYEQRIDELDKLKDENDKYYNSQIDSIKSFLDDEVALYKAACNLIDNDSGELYGNLLRYSQQYTTTTEAEFNHMWQLAQSAMQEYNVANIGTFELLNNLQGRIYEVDGAIDTVADSISSYEGRISGVQSRLDDLSDSAKTAISNISAAIEATNNLGNNGNGKKTSFWVQHNGKKYQTGYNYNGDTKSNRLLAAAELTKLIAKDVSGFDSYGLGIVQGYLGVGTSNAKQWYYDFQGKRYTAVSSKKDNAIQQILSQIERKYGTYPASAATIYGEIKHYVSGTRSSIGGVSVTQEEGFEAILGKLQNGQYTMMPQGSQVFNSDMTDNLWNFSSDPQKFMSDVMSKASGFLSARYGNISDSLGSVTNKVTKFGGDVSFNSAPVFNIQGNVDNATLNTIKKQEQKLYEKYKKQFMLEILKEKYEI